MKAGSNHSEAAKKRMSEARLLLPEEVKRWWKGKKHSEATKKKISEARLLLPEEVKRTKGMTGRRLTEETRKKMSQARKGKVRSESFRANISKALRGRIFSEEWRRKLSLSHTGKVPSLKTRKKLSEATSRRLASGDCFKPTRWENEVSSWLKERGIPFTYNYQIPESPHPYDFFLPDFNLLIELDGCYWHPCQVCYPSFSDVQKEAIENDLRNTQIALNSGYQLLRIWEHDSGKKFQLIEEFLGARGE